MDALDKLQEIFLPVPSFLRRRSRNENTSLLSSRYKNKKKTMTAVKLFHQFFTPGKTTVSLGKLYHRHVHTVETVENRSQRQYTKSDYILLKMLQLGFLRLRYSLLIQDNHYETTRCKKRLIFTTQLVGSGILVGGT